MRESPRRVEPHKGAAKPRCVKMRAKKKKEAALPRVGVRRLTRILAVTMGSFLGEEAGAAEQKTRFLVGLVRSISFEKAKKNKFDPGDSQSPPFKPTF